MKRGRKPVKGGKRLSKGRIASAHPTFQEPAKALVVPKPGGSVQANPLAAAVRDVAGADVLGLAQGVQQYAPKVAAALGAAGVGSGTVGSAIGALGPAAAALAPLAIPFAAVGVIAASILAPLLGKSDEEKYWEAQMQAQYGFHREDVVKLSPFDAGTYHFGSYTGAPPIDTGLRKAGRLL